MPRGCWHCVISLFQWWLVCLLAGTAACMAACLWISAFGTCLYWYSMGFVGGGCTAGSESAMVSKCCCCGRVVPARRPHYTLDIDKEGRARTWLHCIVLSGCSVRPCTVLQGNASAASSMQRVVHCKCVVKSLDLVICLLRFFLSDDMPLHTGLQRQAPCCNMSSGVLCLCLCGFPCLVGCLLWM